MSACDRCGAATVRIVAVEDSGLPHGHRDHAFAHSTEDVHACPSGHGLAVHHSHDCFQPPWEEDWEMSWRWRLSPDSVAALRRGMASCPAPLDGRCACPAHLALREQKGVFARHGHPTVAIVLGGDGLPRYAEDVTGP